MFYLRTDVYVLSKLSRCITDHIYIAVYVGAKYINLPNSDLAGRVFDLLKAIGMFI